MSSGKNSPKKIEIAERRRRAVSLRKSGLTFDGVARVISKEFVGCEKYNDSQAFKDVQHYYQKLEAEALEDCRWMRMMDSERIELAMFAIHRQVLQGDLAAVDRWLRLIQAHSQLWGLNLPPAERPLNQEFATGIELELITG